MRRARNRNSRKEVPDRKTVATVGKVGIKKMIADVDGRN
jgi:hypothetical protein